MNKVIYIDNLGDEQKQKFNDSGFDVLTPKEVLAETLVDTDSLVVLCELDIDKNGDFINRSEFYGIKLVQELRRNKFMGKVLFVSFLPSSYLINNKPFNSIVHTVGHSFLQLPHHPNLWINKLNDINVLDNVEWYDIESNYCNKEGLAQQVLHQLHGLVNDSSFTSDYLESEIKNSIIQIGQLYNENTTKFIEKLDFNDNAQDIINEVDKYCNDIIKRNITTEDNSIIITDKLPWSALFLDDEINCEHKLIKELEKRIKKVFCVRTATEAEKILNEDIKEGHKIALVIADYRLYTIQNNVKIHQKKQGYAFLMQTSSEYPYLSLVAFSSLSRRFLLQSFKRMGIRVDVYSKKDYLASDTTLKILVDELTDKGNEAFDIINRLPRLLSHNWDLYEPFYAHHRQSVNYLENEKYISIKAKTYCNNYKKNEISFDLTGYTVALKKKKPQNDKHFNEFLEKMVCRRAILWFSRMSSETPVISPTEILPFLKGKSYTGNEKETTAKNQINTNLAMRLTDFPWNMTIEEKEWLINQMGEKREKIEDIEDKENEILTFAQSIIQKLEPEQDFQPNTFTHCKMWLSEAVKPDKISKNSNISNDVIKIKNKLLRIINSVNTQPKLIQILERKLFSKNKKHKSILFQYKSLIDFYNFLTRLNGYIKTIPIINQDIPTFDNFIKQVTKEYNNDPEIIATAYLFYNDLKEKAKLNDFTISGFKNYYLKYKKSLSKNPFTDISLDKVSFALEDENTKIDTDSIGV